MPHEENVIEFASRARRTPRRRRPIAATGIPLAGLIGSWRLALEAANKSPNTIEMYLRVANRFVAFLESGDHPRDAETLNATEVRAFLVHERQRAGVPTAVSAHAYLGVWFSWIIAEGERSIVSPVLKSDKPQMASKARKYLTLDELAALLGACRGTDFGSRRDTAMIRVLIDNGARVSGLTGLRLDDVDLRGKRLRIRLKGGREHWVPIGDKTAQAIDRYMRVRARHRRADCEWLWLGIRSVSQPRFTTSGVQYMLERRGRQAGVENVHPHRFRSTSAHMLLANGAHPDDVRRVLGWESNTMLTYYTEELADERARSAHARHSPSDRL